MTTPPIHTPTVNLPNFYPYNSFSLKDLIENESLPEDIAVDLGNMIYHGTSTVVAGGAGSGKTALLNALAGCIPNDEYVITIEDRKELFLPHCKNVASIISLPRYPEGSGNFTITELIHNSLRMRPDRIIIGELYDSAAYDLLMAMSAGHHGSLATVHANNATGPDVIERLALLVSGAGELSPERTLAIIAGAVDLIITINRYEDGLRRISGVYEVPKKLERENETLTLNPIPLWEFVHETNDAEGKVNGHYEKVNSLSYDETRRHNSNSQKRLTLSELYEVSAIENTQA